jgi:predicted TIM-barrel fold metal-dependent hydrolase
MIIDSHVHTGVRAQGDDVPLERVISNMKALGIDKAVLFTTQGFYSDTRATNDQLAAAAARYPGVLYPWATVDPHEGESAVVELRRAITELGMGGLKLHPWVQGFSTTNPKMDMLMDELVTLDVPLVFHDGSPPWATSLQIANLARRYPTVPVILGHGGLRELWPDALRAARQLDNLWLGTSGVPYHGLQKMVDTLGPERLLFGTDGGAGHPSSMAYRLEVVKALQISDEAREAILGKNIAGLMGLSQ